MTNAQKWIAIFLGLFIILLGITYVTESGDNESFSSEGNEVQVNGQQVYSELQCANCHGTNLDGTEQGPALLNLAQNWSKTELINFLRNPRDYDNSDRINELKLRYNKSFMPGYNDVELKRLGKLAEFLLTK